jgi:hypothetical protein
VTLSRPVFLNTLRGHADAPVRLVIAGVMAMMLYAFVGNGITVNGQPLLGPRALVLGGNYLLTALLWLLGLGLISRDISSGSIQLVLLRPLSRPTYVLSKWAGLVAVGWAVLLMMHLGFLTHGGLQGVDAPTLGLLFGAQVVQVMAVAAVIALFSSVPMNFGELGLLILCLLAYLVLKGLNLRWQVPGLDEGLRVAWRLVLPSVDYSPGLEDAGQAGLFLSLAVNAGVTVGALAGAMGLLARREFTYAEQAAG